MYYKLCALHDAGVQLILHIFLHHGNRETELTKLSDEIYYYKRNVGLRSQLSLLPYNVLSRNDSTLINDLCKDDAPILFEGIQTCYYLSDNRLKDRTKMVRMHNVEYDYFRQFGKSCKGWRKVFYLTEAFKLKAFEYNLSHADRILPITDADTEYYRRTFPHNDVRLLNCFFDDSVTTLGNATKPYILYHGNLAIIENINTVNFLLDKVAPHLPHGYSLIIAGRKPSDAMMEKAKRVPGVRIIPDPSGEEMDRLICEAHINLLLTFQPTGIKLKLLNALVKGHGHCIANSHMLHGNSLGEICCEAETPEEIIGIIGKLKDVHLTEQQLADRRMHIKQLKYNDISSIIA